jgi:arylformamidase
MPAKVYLDYTQEELDRAYDQTAWANNRSEMVAWYAAESAKARAKLEFRRSVRYGPGEDETLDIFPAAAAGAPVHVHVHGGRWSVFTKEDMSFIAPTFVAAGAACVVLDFSCIPKVRIPAMVEQVKRAIAWVHANAASFGADAQRVHLSGHSSGAHLAGVALLTDWEGEFGLPSDTVKSGLLISGMYDLRPVMLSARSSYVKLSAGEVDALSAILRPEALAAPVTLVCGDRETPEFRRQPREFAAVLGAADKSVELVEIEGVNHFEILRQFGGAGSRLSRKALGLMF